MKKLLLFSGLFLICTTTFAQSVSFGIRGGVNFSNLQASPTMVAETEKTGSLTSFSAGVFADLKLGNISLQPGLFLTGKGGQDNLTFPGDANTTVVNQKINLLYAQIPVDIVYHVPILIGNIYFGAGPYVAAGITGKLKGTTTLVLNPDDASENQTNSFDKNAKFGNSSDSDFKLTEFGANVIAGVKFKSGFLVNINYDLGLSNILSDANTTGDKLKTRVLGLSIGYAF